MVFNATFNNISVILWRSILLTKETRVHRENHRPATSLTNFITYCCIRHSSPWTGFKLTTLVVIGTDCTNSCKSNYNTITTMTAPNNITEIIKKNIYSSEYFFTFLEMHLCINCHWLLAILYNTNVIYSTIVCQFIDFLFSVTSAVLDEVWTIWIQFRMGTIQAFQGVFLLLSLDQIGWIVSVMFTCCK